MKSFLILLVGVALGGAAGWFGARYLEPAPNGTAPNGTTPSDPQFSEVRALGRIVPAGGIIEIGAIPTELISSISAKVGCPVAQGQELARLASYDVLQRQIAALEAKRTEAVAQAAAEKALLDEQIARAKLAFDEARLSESDIEAQREQIVFLKKKHEQDQKELERLRSAPPTLVSAQDIERQRLLVAKTESDLQAAERAVTKLTAAKELALRSAQAELDVLEASKKRIDAQLSLESFDAEIASLGAQQQRSIVRAPSDGEILEIYAQPGELVGNQPILRMANLGQMNVVAEVYESAKKHIQKGQKVTIDSPALRGNPLHGVVQRIGSIVATPEMRSLDPFDPADRRVFDVTIELTSESAAHARDLVSAPVDVTIRVEASGDGNAASPENPASTAKDPGETAAEPTVPEPSAPESSASEPTAPEVSFPAAPDSP